jgi:hypothetical protein
MTGKKETSTIPECGSLSPAFSLYVWLAAQGRFQ